MSELNDQNGDPLSLDCSTQRFACLTPEYSMQASHPGASMQSSNHPQLTSSAGQQVVQAPSYVVDAQQQLQQQQHSQHPMMQQQTHAPQAMQLPQPVAFASAPQQQPSQPQQQQQKLVQNFPHHRLNGGWRQSDKDYNQERRKMIAKILHLLQQRKPDAPQELLKKLPESAKRVEGCLYRTAKSFEEYNDANTLNNRLEQLAVILRRKKAKKIHQQPSQSQQQQLVQHFPHQGLNGGWQSGNDFLERRNMIVKIVHLLKQRNPNAPQEWLKKLPQMAKRLEESLYRSAKSFEEYNDANTLNNRFQQLFVKKTKTIHQQQRQGLLQQQQQQNRQEVLHPAQVLLPQPQQQQVVQIQPAPEQPLVQPQTQEQARVVPQAPVQQQQQQQQQHQTMQPMPPQPPPLGPQSLGAQPGAQMMVNMAGIDPMIGGGGQQARRSVHQQVPVAAAAAAAVAPGVIGETSPNHGAPPRQQLASPSGNAFFLCQKFINMALLEHEQ